MKILLDIEASIDRWNEEAEEAVGDNINYKEHDLAVKNYINNTFKKEVSEFIDQLESEAASIGSDVDALTPIAIIDGVKRDKAAIEALKDRLRDLLN